MADLVKMMDTAGQQLFLYPEVTAGDRLGRFIKGTFLGRKQAPVDPFSWPNAMLAGGLLAAFAGTGREQGFLDAAAYLERWGRKKYRIHHVDNVMNGTLALWIGGLLERQAEGGKVPEIGKPDGDAGQEECAPVEKPREIAPQPGEAMMREECAPVEKPREIAPQPGEAMTRETRAPMEKPAAFPGKKGGVRGACHEAWEACADWLRHAPRTANGIYPYRPQHPDWIFADTIGMVCPFLCRYGAQEGDETFLRTGASQILFFLEKGMDRASGLPYHGYDEKTGVKYGVIGWGRACGWLLKGMAESLPWLAKGAGTFPDGRGEFDRILYAYRDMARAVLLHQRPDGGFSWQLPAEEGPRDSSAEGMIGTALSLGLRYGFLSGMQDGWAAETALQRLSDALEQSVDGGLVRDCSGECMGFAQYPQVYGQYPWGQGSVLEFFGAEAQRNRKYVKM